MREDYQPLVQNSPYGGQLLKEEIEGSVDGRLNPENNVDTVKGNDRSMYAYVPSTGVPHAKQAQVLFVLRNDASEESAVNLLETLKLKELAEDRHFILLFPNPAEEGWNYTSDPAKEDDGGFLVRCFAALKKTKHGCAGFNGMIFHLGTDPESSAMVMTFASEHPLDAAAVMAGSFPEGYVIPEGKHAEETAWIYDGNKAALKHVLDGNGESEEVEEDNVKEYRQKVNPCVRCFYSEEALTSDEVEKAWETMFSTARRWRNDVYGIYQPRVDYKAKGYIKHYEDSSLGVNNNFPHTWYEYVPEKVKESGEKAPLLFYFHGINCTPLYGPEQSGLTDIADRDGIILVFPSPAIEERWNVWDDPRLPSDASFITALVEHMKKTYAIDEKRIYVSGFSMGSMFTNAMACSYPEVFAGAMAFNGPHAGYLSVLDDSRKGMLMFNPKSMIKDLEPSDETVSVTHARADEKKNSYDYRMPFVQTVGLLDGVGFNPGKTWPITSMEDGSWLPGINYWKAYNNIPVEEDCFDSTISGLKADETVDNGRNHIQKWYTQDEGHLPLYQLQLSERMPHAIEYPEVETAWSWIKHFERNEDGSLTYTEE